MADKGGIPSEQEARNLIKEAKEAERAGDHEEAEFLREGIKEIKSAKIRVEVDDE